MRGTLERSVSMSLVMVTQEEGEQEGERGKKLKSNLVEISFGMKRFR